MNQLFRFAIAAVGLSTFSACNNSPPKEGLPAMNEPKAAVAASAEANAVEYYCPMHPQVVQNEPGNCPVCKMKLEARPKPGH